MDWDQQENNDQFPFGDDEETDELGLRIAAHAKRRQQELDNDATSPDYVPPSPPITRRNRAADWKLDDATKPREPFWRAKERRALDENDNIYGVNARPKQHLRAVSDGPPLPSPSDLPVNIPQTWGGRNRHRAHWLNRSTTEGEGLGLLESIKKVDADTVLLHRPRFTGDDILASGGNTPLHTRRRTLQFSSPNSLGNMNTTLPHEVDDLEFNEDSVIVSTPAAPVNRRNRKIDEIMKEEEDEMISVEKQNTTTQRTSRFSTRTGTATADRPLSAPDGSENRPFPRWRRQSAKEKEQATSLTNQTEEETRRHLPAVTFRDSDNSTKDLLRRLARVSSLSPSPAPDKVLRDERRKSDDAKDRGDVDGDTSHVPTVRQRPGRKTPSVSNLFKKAERETSRTSERRINIEPSQPKSALEAVLNEGKGDIGDSTIASLEDIVNPDLDDSSVVVEKKGTRKDAVVEEKTDDEGEDRRRREEREFEDANRRLRVARTSIKDADRGLRRLENRLENTHEDHALHTPEDEEPIRKEPPQEAVTRKEAPQQEPIRKEPRPQPQPLPPVKQEAESAKATTRQQSDTTKRPSRSQSKPEDLMEIPYQPPPLPKHFEPYTDHNNRTLCQHCGGRYTSVWMGLWTEFRELFYRYDEIGEDALGLAIVKLRLTWLGWIFAAWWTWIAVEIFAYRMFPEHWLAHAKFPFIGITMLVKSARWCLDLGGNFLLGAGSSGSAKVNMSSLGEARREARTRKATQTVGGLGDWDGENWVAAAAAATQRATQRVVGSAVEAVDEVGRIWQDDEYLDL